jgi:hypothetical protein
LGSEPPQGSAQDAAQVPLPSQVPPVQLLPAVFGEPSAQVGAPVPQAMRPARHSFWLVVHEAPAVQSTQTALALHTLFPPQLTPVFAAPATQVELPVPQKVTPAAQALLGLVAQATPALQGTQLPALHTLSVPQVSPSDLAW